MPHLVATLKAEVEQDHLERLNWSLLGGLTENRVALRRRRSVIKADLHRNCFGGLEAQVVSDDGSGNHT